MAFVVATPASQSVSDQNKSIVSNERNCIAIARVSRQKKSLYVYSKYRVGDADLHIMVTDNDKHIFVPHVAGTVGTV